MSINLLLCVGYIDLSKRRVSAEEIQKCEETFSKAKTVSMHGVNAGACLLLHRACTWLMMIQLLTVALWNG